jgi:hypothetical protein
MGENFHFQTLASAPCLVLDSSMVNIRHEHMPAGLHPPSPLDNANDESTVEANFGAVKACSNVSAGWKQR